MNPWGEGGSPQFVLNPIHIFCVTYNLIVISEPYGNPFWGKSNPGRYMRKQYC
jgi:hypothetical protein